MAVSSLRVVQWTTGKSGSAAVRGMLGHPRLSVVGCYAFSPDKVGQDVGVLCGVAPIGGHGRLGGQCDVRSCRLAVAAGVCRDERVCE